ncbi:hypothetical protein HGRIS_011690 [Hohenbuehelia grisea]|uniref:Integrase core domain-containing protein n=1 Tax=Hohenbuehelia grisea TaxID=104357 RepID=A0ABR3JW25_9AGAR
MKDHYDTSQYGLSAASVKRLRKKHNLLSTRQQKHTLDSIKDAMVEIRTRFPLRGSEGIRKSLGLEYGMFVPRPLVSQLLKQTEPEAVQNRKRRQLRRKRYWAAGPNDAWSQDQHDKWARFGLWVHVSVCVFTSDIKWLKIWHNNRNPQLICRYYLEAVRKEGGAPLVTQSDPGTENFGVANAHTTLRHRMDPSLQDTLQHRFMHDKQNIKAEIVWSQFRRDFTPGFESLLDKGLHDGTYNPNDPLESLLFRWIFIPWLQKEIDNWVFLRNFSAPRADKNKVLPHGIPALINQKPERYGTFDFKVPVDSALLDELEQNYAPPDHEVMQLVPALFALRAQDVYTSLHSPVVTSVSVWDIFRDMLAQFKATPSVEVAVVVQSHQPSQHLAVPDPEAFPDEYIIQVLDALFSYLLPLIYSVMNTQQETADFTIGDPNPVCQHCKARYPTADMKFIRGQNGQSGQLLCLACREYYRLKAQRASDLIGLSVPSGESLGSTTTINVAKQVAAAQRGQEDRPRVRAVGNFTSLHSISHRGMPPPVAPAPRVITPMAIHRGSILPFPRLDGSKKTLQWGYTQAHENYIVMRDHFATQAYATGGTGKITIHPRFATILPGKQKYSPFSDAYEPLGNISPEIGVNDLKTAAFVALYPRFLKWSYDFTLSLDQLCLRAKDWTEIIHNDIAPSPFRALFFTAKTQKFAPGAGLTVYLTVETDLYEKIIDHREICLDREAQIAEQDKSMVQAVAVPQADAITGVVIALDPPNSRNPPPGQSQADLFSARSVGLEYTAQPAQSLKRRVPESQSSVIEEGQVGFCHNASRAVQSTTPVTPPRPRKITVLAPISPSREDVFAALRAQTRSEKKAIHNQYNTISVQCVAFHAPRVSFTDLLKTPLITDIQKSSAPRRITLFFNPSGPSEAGSFKIARIGHTDPTDEPLFKLSSSTRVCIKQAYRKSTTDSAAPPKLYEGKLQAQMLQDEIKCIVYANSLLDLVYNFIDSSDQESAFAPSADANDHVNCAFLLEEMIDPLNEGEFTKYLNNDNAVPLPSNDPDVNLRSDFLSFAQHVQYVKTKKAVFVSDFQVDELFSLIRKSQHCLMCHSYQFLLVEI